MAIPQTKYVDITSIEGATTGAENRELIGRIFTPNPLVPTNSVIEFTSLAAVGSYFGISSEEYGRANFYFNFVSKQVTTPETLSYGRIALTAEAPAIYGAAITETLVGFNAISDGSFTLTIGGVVAAVTGLSFSAAMSLAAVAADIQTAIIAAGTGSQFTGSTVAYSGSTGSFNFMGGSAVVATISVTAGSVGTDISGLIGWLPEAVSGGSGAIWSNGTATQTLTQNLAASVNASNNFGTYCFTNSNSLTLTNYEEIVAWNATQNNLYMLSIPVSASNATTWSDQFLDNAPGTALTLLSTVVPTEFHEMMPMVIEATTNYENPNSTQNYMYQSANLTPTVSDAADALTYDTLGINYYGVTQQAGTNIAFYQNGLLMGALNSPSAMNIYANEQWLKDSAAVAILNQFLFATEVSANMAGVSQILNALQPVIQQALSNGTIIVGKAFTQTQILYVNTVTNTTNAWQQVQNSGYWINGSVSGNVIDYILVYSKGDVVSSVTGTHVLI